MTDRKIDYVRQFYEDRRGEGVVYARKLYRLYAALVPARKKVTQGMFVHWAPEWVEHHKKNERIGPGEWHTFRIINLGEEDGKE